ncbi:MAG: ATP-dependent DNA ligase [Candidatus Woesearchaeota archaeon]
MEFEKFAQCLEQLEGTSKRLEKIEIITALLSKTSQYKSLLLLLEGRVFPVWSPKKLGIASQLALKAIVTTFGIDQKNVETYYNEVGDLGLVAQHFAVSKKQQTLFGPEQLELDKVFLNLQKIADTQGDKTVSVKMGLLSELLHDASPLEARYIIRLALGQLRVGVAFGTLRDALYRVIFPEIVGLYDKKELDAVLKSITENPTLKDDFAMVEDVHSISEQTFLGHKKIVCLHYEDARIVYNSIISAMQHTYDCLNETYSVAEIAREKGYAGLLDVTLELMTPFRVMLMQRVSTVTEASEKISFPFALEYKYDGFRCQIHKKGDDVRLFTRNLDDVTTQFPDIVQRAKACIAGDAILDGEILGVDASGNFLPFQHISQRIKRKYDIETMAETIPVVYATWDVLYHDGETLLDVPLSKRRTLLEAIITASDNFRLSVQKIITTVEEGDFFYKESLAKGNEGVVVKDIHSGYKPGNRVGCWLKIKPIMDPLDVVIVAAEWGDGKRATWLTSFTVAVLDNDEFKTIGKVGTGFKELSEQGTSFDDLTIALKPLIESSKGKEVVVKPEVVIEIAFEEIQKSPTYSSGFALRFPRFLRMREDISVSEIDSLEQVQEYFSNQ